MNRYVNIYPKVVRNLNIIGNIPGIFLIKSGNIIEFCQFGNMETLDTADREDIQIDPSSCFSDFSDSLNSVKVPLHLGKTPLNFVSQG